MEILKKYYDLIDKSAWNRGPWDSEPDMVNLYHEDSDLYCRIIRMESSGSLNGYVALHKGHRWYKKNYNDIDVSVHGGLTYSRLSEKEDEGIEEMMPNVLYEGYKGLTYWIGFDTSHYRDLSPGYYNFRLLQDGEYRDLGYIMNELTELCKQLK